MQDFHSLDVWKRAHGLVLSIYQATKSMPREETFGITMQLRRVATAIPSRIAEGCGGEAGAEQAVNFRRATAACNEVEYLILLSKDLEILKHETFETLTDSVITVRKMLYGLLRKM